METSKRFFEEILMYLGMVFPFISGILFLMLIFGL